MNIECLNSFSTYFPYISDTIDIFVMHSKFLLLYLLLVVYSFNFFKLFFKIPEMSNSYQEITLNFQSRRINKYIRLDDMNSTFFTQAHERHSSSLPNFTIDILTIGSKLNEDLPQMQHETFAQHYSIRTFIVATENDDPDPFCYQNISREEIEEHARKCRSKKFWRVQMKSYNLLTHNFRKLYARPEWLRTKNNIQGWFCAIKRQDYAFLKYMNLLKESGIPLPNYLMVIDDDTYLNVHHIENYLKNSEGNSNVPRSTEPVIFAGCRVRHPVNEMKWTFPFGGWGIYLSEGALKKWMRSIRCEENKNENIEICRLYKNPSKSDITIGEGKYFLNGMNLNEVFKRYLEQEEYCLHGDWFYGYIANFLNISRHVVPHNELPTVGYGGSTAIWYDGSSKENPIDGIDQDFKEKIEAPENRLHTIMGSEIYTVPQGQCLYGNNKGNKKIEVKEVHNYIPVHSKLRKGTRRLWKPSQRCIYNTTICHNVKDTVTMKKLFNEAKLNEFKF